jgi:hypothetical protein
METGKERVITGKKILSGAEHALRASGIVMDGKNVFGPEILQGLADSSTRETFLRPFFSKVGDLSTQEIVRLRGQRPDEKISGILGFLDAGLQWEISKLGLVPYMELAEIDPETGLIIPSWKVGLVSQSPNGEEVGASDHLDLLRLREECKPYFSLEKAKENSHLTLRLNV